MPGFKMHYLFGVKSISEFPVQLLKKSIDKHKGVFVLGTQGPDLFFYHLPSKFLYKQNPGSMMHKKESGLFFRNLIRNVDVLSEESKDIGISYLSGFLAHYSLDLFCHPYVYSRTDYIGKEKGYLGRHIAYESQMDIEMLRRLKDCKPSEFIQSKTMKMTMYEKRLIGKLLYKTLSQTYSESRIHHMSALSAVYMFGWCNRFLHDKKGWKKPLIGKVEKVIKGHETIAAIIQNDKMDTPKARKKDVLNLKKSQWEHPWEEDLISDESVIELWEKSKRFYKRIIDTLEEYFRLYSNEDKSEVLAELNRQIGNLSYHTGFDCRIDNSKKNIKSNKNRESERMKEKV